MRRATRYAGQRLYIYNHSLTEEGGGGATLGSTTHYYGLWDSQLCSDDSADSICFQFDDVEELDWGQVEDDYYAVVVVSFNALDVLSLCGKCLLGS